MFNLRSFDPSRLPARLAAHDGAPPPPRIRRASLLAWEEHCVECAAPACYRSCDLYRDRGDGQCRRFLYGVYANRAFPAWRGYGAQIAFERWAKLEAAGNTCLEPEAAVRRRERWISRLAPWADAAGALLYHATGDSRWRRLSQALLTRYTRWLHRRSADPPSAFLLELYNPDPSPLGIEVAISGEDAPTFQARFEAPPGYSAHEIAAAEFERLTKGGRPFLISLIPEPERRATLVILSADFVEFEPAPQPVKCLVCDLDGTLWDGVLMEDGAVHLKPEAKRTLAALDERGVLLSVASKNDYAAAWRKLEELGLADRFLYPQINWRPKGRNVKEIAARLNIGLDAVAFLDDNPFERAEVAEACPGVRTIDAARLAELPGDPAFRGGASEDARQRRRYYQDAMLRERSLAECGGDYRKFLASCGIALEVEECRDRDFERVVELVQRTNQLNFSGRRYSRAELAAALADPARDKYALRAEDRFGAYGTIGFAIVREERDELTVEDFMLSCRVQAREIECAFLAALRASRARTVPPRLRVIFRATGRNAPARQALESLGLVPDGEGRGMTLGGERPLECDFIRVRWAGAVCGAAR